MNIDNNPVQIDGTSDVPVTVSNTGANPIVYGKSSSLASRIGFIMPGDSANFPERVWIATARAGDTSTYTTSNPQTGGGVELAYAEIVANFAPALAALASADIPGLQITPVVRARPIVVEAYLPNIYGSINTTTIQVFLYEGATMLSYCQNPLAFAGTNGGASFRLRTRLSPTPGPHTYKLTVRTIQAQTPTVVGGANGPASLQAIEV